MHTTRIKSITKLKEKEDTYDLKVYPNNNFFLDNEILTHNSGKSTLSFGLAKWLDPDFTLDNVVFSVDDFLKTITTIKPGSAVVFDEAVIINSRSALSAWNKAILVAMAQIRSRGLFIIMNIPAIFDLDKSLVLSRCSMLLHCYQDSFGSRGKYVVFNTEKLRELYHYGKRLYSYSKPRANFIGQFSEYFALPDRDEYEKKKQTEIAKQAKSKNQNRFSRQRNVLIKYIYENCWLDLKKEERAKNIAGILGDISKDEVVDLLCDGLM